MVAASAYLSENFFAPQARRAIVALVDDLQTEILETTVMPFASGTVSELDSVREKDSHNNDRGTFRICTPSPPVSIPWHVK